MALITGINLPEDGQTASTTDYNAAITKILAAVNGGLDDTNMSANSITDASLAPSADPAALVDALVTDMWISGGIWTVSAGLTGTMSEAVVLINGTSYTVPAVGAKVFSSTQDTYVDVGSDLTLDYTAVAVGANAPATAADHVRLARITTDASNITTITPIRDGGIIRAKLATDAKTPRVYSVATASSITPDLREYNTFLFTGLTSTLTINAPIGVLNDGASIIFRFKGTATRTLTWNSIYRAVGIDIPTSTPSAKTTYVGAIYNKADTKWDIIATSVQE